MSTAYGPLADRPINPKVGLEVSHESAALHVTGTALYTGDLVGRTKDALHAWPKQAPHAHARVTRLDPGPAYAVPGVVKVLTAADVPGLNDAGEKHDEPLFPDEVMFYGHAVCWVLGETPDAARQGAEAVEVDYEPLPPGQRARRHRRRQLPGTPRTLRRGDVEQGLREAAHTFTGELDYGGQEHFYLEGQAALATVDENGQVFVQSSTQHPSETQDIVAHVLGLKRPRGHRAVPADGRRVRRQGVPAARAGRGRRAGRHDHRPPGQPGAEPHPGHHHDRQAAPVLRDLGGRLRRRPAAVRAPGHADQQRRLEPGPVRARARPGPVPHRERLLDPARRGPRPGGQDPPAVQHRLPRLRRPAGHDRDRGDPRPLRAAAGGRAGRAPPAQPLRARPGHPVRPAGPARRTADRHLADPHRAQRLRPALRRGGRVQPRASRHQARAGDHSGQVRHLVQPDGVQPGRGAGARLQGRLGADQPRRHRDGPGPAHQDDPGGRDRARGAAVLRPAGADPDRQGAQHLGHRRQLRAPT